MGSTFSYIDLNFLGLQKAIATAIVETPHGVVLVDPGPSSCLDALESGLRARSIALDDVTDIFLTHIHLDHAGATGTIVRRHPRIRVFVHSRGARHLVDPTKLIESASRFFGAEQMERYWSEIAPVPPDRIVVLDGGERVQGAGRHFDVIYTPGHAWHHVTYFDASSGVGFVGDAAGLCIEGGFILPPTPPPDVDVDQWTASIERIAALRADTIVLTHFGAIQKVDSHLEILAANLHRLADNVRQSLMIDESDLERSRQFGRFVRDEIHRKGAGPSVQAYEPTAPIESLWFGLARYWRTKERTQ